MSSEPKIDLTTFVLSVSTAAYMGLGIAPRSEGEEPQVDLELAKQNIDLLELLWEKTRGNRTADEEKLLSQLLLETRLRFVETQKKHHP